MICKKCGNEMASHISGRNYIIECPGCGWNCVTTYTEPIYEDQATYAISILPGGPTTKPALSAISKLAETNFLGAKSIAEQGGEGIFEALAPVLREKKALLDDAGVPYRIDPEFPY
jgi:Na+-translocating ferredoxin:NAD+ oxidoreductase RNF subunit RnfB